MDNRRLKTQEQLKPYTIEELRAGILESEKQFAEGRFKTIEEVFEELGEPFEYEEEVLLEAV
ncbi:MAG: hypothetical protein J6T96_05910 [Bacteroidales bacterium]|nr:hypothetical protein [Bacteroidales bacterium]MBO7462113.1 hypothetical protein [Bacteroidales bacterium]